MSAVIELVETIDAVTVSLRVSMTPPILPAESSGAVPPEALGNIEAVASREAYSRMAREARLLLEQAGVRFQESREWWASEILRGVVEQMRDRTKAAE